MSNTIPSIYFTANGTEDGTVAPPVMEDTGAAEAGEAVGDEQQAEEEPEPEEFTPNVVCVLLVYNEHVRFFCTRNKVWSLCFTH